MNRHDRERWKACATLAQVGDCVADWLTGGIEAVPGHEAPPDPETTPYVMLLCAVNRRGLVTLNMDDSDGIVRGWPYGASVHGLTPLGRLEKLARACAGHDVVVITETPRRKRSWLAEWPGMVQDSAYAEMRRARCVIVADPVRGRAGSKSPLWRALREFAR